MRRWVLWCIKHRMSWLVLLVMILSIPIYLFFGCWTGCASIMVEWADDWRSIRRKAKEPHHAG